MNKISPTTPEDVLQTVEHRPYPLPLGKWAMRQRWNDLLFAHWPIPAAAMAALLPAGLEVDTYDGFAWIGVIPFWMDEVQNRIPFQRDGRRTVSVPTTRVFSELNLRTYVRSPRTGLRGVFFFSLDCASALAVLGARVLFHLPYFLASMRRTQSEDGVAYSSQRRLSRRSVRFDATYRSLPQTVPARLSQPGTLEHFLTERYCLFTPFRRHILVGHIHHLPWPLERAEADIRTNELPGAHGITLPQRSPILHFARELHVYIWPLRPDVRLP